jgi:large-conductance mechanosensitive channel
MLGQVISFIIIGSFVTFCMVGVVLLIIDSEKKLNEQNNDRR